MRVFWKGCDRFSYLINAKAENEWSPEEAAFVKQHQDNCSKCAEYHESECGINLMRSCVFDPVPSKDFDRRTIRRALVATGRVSLSYWSPALVGAAIAGLAILSAIQMVARPSQIPVFNSAGEAHRVEVPIFPVLEKAEPKHSNQ